MQVVIPDHPLTPVRDIRGDGREPHQGIEEGFQVFMQPSRFPPIVPSVPGPLYGYWLFT
jgi:hypothetical protein